VVGFGLHPQVQRAEAQGGDLVGSVQQVERQRQVGHQVDHRGEASVASVGSRDDAPPDHVVPGDAVDVRTPGQRPTGALAVARSLLVATRLHDLVRQACVRAERLDPSRRAGLRRAAAAPPLGLACVYRAANAPVVQELITQLPEGTPVALWALDRVVPELVTSTIGSGPGLRLALLQRCADAVDLGATGWLVLADDDVALPAHGLVDAVRLAAAAGLDLAQPAHSWTSWWNFSFTRRRLGTVARSGGMVESGPLVLLGPAARALALPLPVELGMGWGVEVTWWRLRAKGIRLGIVDAVPMRHLAPLSDRYDTTAEQVRLAAAFRAEGLRDWGDLQRDDEVWRPWRRPPRPAVTAVAR